MGGVKLVDFVDLSLDEKKMVLNWRNEESVKKWMYSQDDIVLENHLQYIDTLEASKTKQYMVVKILDQYIGVIDFTNINFQAKVTDFGLYANPSEKVAGVGRILEECCVKYAFEILQLDKMMLEVFSDNERAINLYKKYNFQEVGKKEINNKEVICMELRNENRKV
ncbi:MAG: UDP-4-amino-4,6-dideoxy-N-acetyl-beta-L-altrosamine N-acetyltransferase [Sulfurimonas sp.]|jgi:UDP-4-amino-4,6-dideoxy-N-acetyl-beta-L-altrosamine N-acetyltransferase